ncbi:MAG: D-alanyl-D-alanine carboxypeptidase family protein [Myxococcota bacterium]
MGSTRCPTPRRLTAFLALGLGALPALLAACDEGAAPGPSSLLPDVAANASGDTARTDLLPPPDAADGRTDPGRSDLGSDATRDAGPELPPDAADPDAGSDTPAPDVPPDADTPEPDVPDPAAWACDTEARVAACEAPLLHDGAPMPTDPADLLYYVNRHWEIPPDYPVAEGSDFNPCYEDPASGATHDLVCVPHAYRTKPVGLRQAAWASPAPADLEATHDGKAVGFLEQDGSRTVGFRALFDAALEEAGAELYVASGFRSWSTQDATFAWHVDKEMNNHGWSEDHATLVASTYSARPGHSEHQLGTTADMVYRKDDGTLSSFGRAWAEEMAASWQMQWVMAHAHRFGIVLTYGRDEIAATQYVWEPWHWRYVGVEAADAMRACELNTEELLSARYDVGPMPPYEGEDLILYDEAEVTAASHTGTEPVEAGAPMTRSWTLHNAGTTNWSGYLLGHVDGEAFGGGDVEVPCTTVSQDVTVTLDLTAPTEPGLHEGTWQLLTPEGAVVPGVTVDVTAWIGDEGEGSPYRYVRIVDISGATGGADPGADIDAVALTRAETGETVFASAAPYYDPAPGAPAHDDPTEATGAPDAFHAWPDDPTVCDVGGGFVSLGGGGTLIVDMGVPVSPGDTLTVLEVGACTWSPGQEAFADPIEVDVSVGDTPGDTWEPVGSGDGGAVDLTVPFLPPASEP